MHTPLFVTQSEGVYTGPNPLGLSSQLQCRRSKSFVHGLFCGLSRRLLLQISNHASKVFGETAALGQRYTLESAVSFPALDLKSEFQEGKSDRSLKRRMRPAN